MSESFPKGWHACCLGDVVRVRGGFAFSSKDFGKSGVPVVRQSNLAGSRVDLSNAVYVPERLLRECARFQLTKGDILIGMSGSLGKLCTYSEDFPALQNQRTGMLEFKSSDPDLKQFVWWFMHTVEEALTKKGKGVAVQNVSFTDVEQLPLQLPPLNEQRRIVAKLEALQARSRRAREALDAVPPLLEKLRQSILAAAFRGDLTKDWRAKHKDVEPASELLKRIRTERRKKWEEAELAKLKAKGKPPTDDKWKAKYKEPAPVDTTGLPELPEGWCWARAEEVCDFITKGTTPSAEKLAPTGDVPFIKVYNLTFHGDVDFTVDPTFVDRATHSGALARSRVVPGDVLMNIVGPPLGKVGIVPDTFAEWNMNQAIAVFRVLVGLSRHYLALHLLSSRTVQWAVREGKATAGQLNLTLEICRDLPVPLCCEAEQAQVVVSLNEAMVTARRLSRATESSLAQGAQLERAVLAKAFRGELVPQDPSDEPAAVTLADAASTDGATNGVSIDSKSKAAKRKGRDVQASR